jgi:RNA-directed DNA polymerase
LERYTSWLSTKYEAFLGAQKFGPTVLAYRRGVGNNISQAKMLFEEIREKREVTAIGLDISGFFDHIRHSVLLDGLHKVLGVDRLNLADHKIYKRMTNFEWVEASKIDERLRGAPRDPGRICNAYQFRRFIRTKVDNLVEVNHADYGIPQGTPLSGLYANISMIDFDEHMHAHFSYIGASYRRYSDDIAIVMPAGIDVAEQVDFVKSYLSGMGLALSAAKTDISTFKFSSGALASDKPFQYLGFTFDGKKILIRQFSLNRYYAKMKSGVVAKVIAAKRKGVPSDSIYMRELFRKYTHFGKHRNFPRYVYRASSELGSPEMRAQIANHFEIFKEVTRITVDSVYS